MPLAALLEHYWARRSRNRLWRHSAAPRARLGQTPKQAVYRVSMGDIRRVSSSSMYGARGVAGTSFLGRTGQNKPEFGLWHAVLRTIAVFLALRGGSMSVELVRWLPKAGFFLSIPSGTQRACPLVPTACF